jgi:ABC-type uncharacterized transport system permease subunit
MTESRASADLRLKIQAKANAINLAFGTMFGAYAGAIFSTRLEVITSDIIMIGVMLFIIAYGSTSPALEHPRGYRKGMWWAASAGDWMPVIGAPVLWTYATGRMDLGAGILFVWMLFSNVQATVSRHHRRVQRRIEINNKRWMSRIKP